MRCSDIFKIAGSDLSLSTMSYTTVEPTFDLTCPPCDESPELPQCPTCPVCQECTAADTTTSSGAAACDPAAGATGETAQGQQQANNQGTSNSGLTAGIIGGVIALIVLVALVVVGAFGWRMKGQVQLMHEMDETYEAIMIAPGGGGGGMAVNENVDFSFEGWDMDRAAAVVASFAEGKASSTADVKAACMYLYAETIRQEEAARRGGSPGHQQSANKVSLRHCPRGTGMLFLAMGVLRVSVGCCTSCRRPDWGHFSHIVFHASPLPATGGTQHPRVR